VARIGRNENKEIKEERKGGREDERKRKKKIRKKGKGVNNIKENKKKTLAFCNY